MSMSAEIASAIENNELRLDYQPKVDAASSLVTGDAGRARPRRHRGGPHGSLQDRKLDAGSATEYPGATGPGQKPCKPRAAPAEEARWTGPTHPARAIRPRCPTAAG